MKQSRVIIALVLAALMAQGGEGDVLRGGLVGGAFGALVSELDHAADPGITIPVFAGVGALTGYLWDKDRDDHSRHGYRYPHRYRYDTHYRWRGPYAWQPQPFYYSPYQHSAIKTPPPPRLMPPKRNRHPGVSLLSIPITLKNGMKVDITVFKLNDRYVGPKGEHYDSLPTSEMLAQRYAQ